MQIYSAWKWPKRFQHSSIRKLKQAWHLGGAPRTYRDTTLPAHCLISAPNSIPLCHSPPPSQPSPIHFTAVWMSSRFTGWCWGRTECHFTSLCISLYCIHCCVYVRASDMEWNGIIVHTGENYACPSGHNMSHLVRCAQSSYVWGYAFLGRCVLIRAY